MKIAVIGLGIAGLSICVRLAEAGHSVSGFEQFALMHERGSSHGDTRITRTIPGEGDIYVRLAAHAAPMWRAWEALNGAPLIRWTGGLMAGPRGSAFVGSCIALGEAHGEPGRVLRPVDVAVATQGRIFFPNDWEIVRQDGCGTVLADAVRTFLIARARDRGAVLHDNARIDALEETGLTIAGETQRFDAVILAAGGWAARLAPELAYRLTVKRRVLGWFAGPSDNLPVICADDDAGLYGMPTPDGHYKIGLHTVGDTIDPDEPTEPDAQDAAALSAHMAQFLPRHDPKPRRMKRCLYTLTPDQNFLVTPSHACARVLIVSCCSGHGFKYAAAYGDIALDWIEGRPSAFLDAFGAARPAATPLGAAYRK